MIPRHDIRSKKEISFSSYMWKLKKQKHLKLSPLSPQEGFLAFLPPQAGERKA